MSNFDQIATPQLQAQYDTIKGLDGMGSLASAMLAELDYRAANAEKIANTAAMRALADQASNLLAGIVKSPVAEISGEGSRILRDARRTLIGLITAAYDVNVARAEKVLIVLADTRGQTDVGGNVGKAVEYVLAHPKSTVYSQTDPADESKGAEKSESKANESKANESKANESK